MLAQTTDLDSRIGPANLPGYRPIPRWCWRCPGEPVGTRPLGPLGPCPSGDTAIPVWTRCPTGAAPSRRHTPSKTTRNWRTHRTCTSTVCRWRSGIGTPYPDDLQGENPLSADETRGKETRVARWPPGTGCHDLDIAEDTMVLPPITGWERAMQSVRSDNTPDDLLIVW